MQTKYIIASLVLVWTSCSSGILVNAICNPHDIGLSSTYTCNPGGVTEGLDFPDSWCNSSPSSTLVATPSSRLTAPTSVTTAGSTMGGMSSVTLTATL